MKRGGNYIAAVYFEDDYGNMLKDSQWAKTGDTVALRYVDEWEYYDTETGDILDPDNITEDQPYNVRPLKYRDVEYEVVASVGIPNSLTYRYYGSDEFILNAQTFIRDTGTSSVMYYAVGSIVITLIFSVVMAPLASKILGSMFWFFTYHFMVLPIICVVPLFALLGAVIPLMTYHFVAKHSVVERLREAE